MLLPCHGQARHVHRVGTPAARRLAGHGHHRRGLQAPQQEPLRARPHGGRGHRHGHRRGLRQEEGRRRHLQARRPLHPERRRARGRGPCGRPRRVDLLLRPQPRRHAPQHHHPGGPEPEHRPQRRRGGPGPRLDRGLRRRLWPVRGPRGPRQLRPPERGQAPPGGRCPRVHLQRAVLGIWRPQRGRLLRGAVCGSRHLPHAFGRAAGLGPVQLRPLLLHVPRPGSGVPAPQPVRPHRVDLHPGAQGLKQGDGPQHLLEHRVGPGVPCRVPPRLRHLQV
mmetsp:Transcript_15608/g.49766  ORF Transcript_15608/g.49766 Transcript_15608/m.49766 type:complete len:278 (-) Transcript_15608:678-1511(-)